MPDTAPVPFALVILGHRIGTSADERIKAARSGIIRADFGALS